MKLDVNALGTFYRMAREGAGLAAGRLSRLTDVDTRVGVTKLNFMRASEIRTDFEDGTEKVGVRVELSKSLAGHSLIVFDRENALRVVETLLPDATDADDDRMVRSAVTEIGQILNSGYIDGWANVLGAVIDVSPPEYVAGETAEPFFGEVEMTPAEDDLALLFQSQIEAVDTEIGFAHYMFPDHDSMDRILRRLRSDDARGIEYDKLVGFDRMARQGAREVAKNATTMTGIETEVEIRRLNFVSLEAITEEIPDERLVSVGFELDGLPSGYLLFLFDEGSAEEIVAAMLPKPPDDPLGRMGQSAIMELGNILASGFLDGWANVLGTTIDHSPPEFNHDLGTAVVDPIAVRLGEDQDYAFVFDTEITAEGRRFDCDILAIPSEADLVKALNDLKVDRIDETPTTAEFPIDEVRTDDRS